MKTVILTMSGVFAGATVESNVLFDLKDFDGNVTLRDGQVVQGVPIAALTPIFLDTFPPDEGWGVITEHKAGDFSLPDPFTLDASGQPIPQPTEWVTAKLVDPVGRVVAQATSLVVINGPKAFERGETIARGRLYEALGLPRTTAPVVDEPEKRAHRCDPQPAKPAPVVEQPAPSSTETPLLAAVEALPSGRRPGYGPAPAAAPPMAAKAEEQASETAQSAVDSSTQPTEPAPAQSSPAAKTSDGAPPKRSTLKVIERQAKSRGIQVPAFTTEDEAAGFLRQLRAGGLN